MSTTFTSKNMDFFHTNQSTTPPAIQDEAEACAAILMACLRANELDGDAQNATFYTAIGSRNIFKGYQPEALIQSAAQYFEQAGGSAVLIDMAVGAVREQTRLPLFYHCLDVILADGLVTPMEHKVFLYLQGKFKLDDELAWKAMEVLVTKNKL